MKGSHRIHLAGVAGAIVLMLTALAVSSGIDGRKVRASGTVCRRRDGRWMLTHYRRNPYACPRRGCLQRDSRVSRIKT
jgi:hypothetical protein